jgi:biopolymer transport protein ExbD
MHEISVTPFIDVMLGLLIVFMVAAPLSTVDVPVDLPAPREMLGQVLTQMANGAPGPQLAAMRIGHRCNAT